MSLPFANAMLSHLRGQPTQPLEAAMGWDASKSHGESGAAGNILNGGRGRPRAFARGENRLTQISEGTRSTPVSCAPWNGGDPIPKDRRFGITIRRQGNPGGRKVTVFERKESNE